jgi:hypothetical protein
MARINIICEGPTEVKIIKDIIGPHLAEKHQHFCFPFDLEGNPNADRIAHFLTKWIKQEPESYFTTMVDYYGLKPSFPGFSDNPNLHYLEKAHRIETAFKLEIENRLPFRPHLIPYFQMHEFEALLFSDCSVLWSWLNLDNPNLTLKEVENHIKGFESPEEINQKKETSPSHRILGMVGSSYHKPKDGKLIFGDISLDKIRSVCPHFNKWMATLESIPA